jgi:hypothetical protein
MSRVRIRRLFMFLCFQAANLAYTRLTHSYTCLTVLHLHIAPAVTVVLIDSESESCFRVGSTGTQCMSAGPAGRTAACGRTAGTAPCPDPASAHGPVGLGTTLWPVQGTVGGAAIYFFFLISSSLYLKGLGPLGSSRKPDPRSPKADPPPGLKSDPLHH